MRITTAQAKGPRPYQEDTYAVIKDSRGGVLLAVCDGHGGGEASEKAIEVLKLIDKLCNGYSEFTEDTMRTLFSELNFYTEEMECGSTASLAYITPDQTKVIVGVLGDSPVFVVNNELQFHQSPEHNARTNIFERQAAEGRGATYLSPGYIYDLGSQNTWSGFVDAKGLQMTRALGDKALARVLSREPEVYTINLSSVYSTVVVASDGILDPSHIDVGVNQRVEWLKYGIYGEDTAQQILNRVEQEFKLEDNATIIVANLGIDE